MTRDGLSAEGAPSDGAGWTFPSTPRTAAVVETRMNKPKNMIRIPTTKNPQETASSCRARDDRHEGRNGRRDNEVGSGGGGREWGRGGCNGLGSEEWVGPF